MISILLADDDVLTLNRLMGMLDWNAHGYEVIGQAHGGNECLRLVQKCLPNILILDIDMPDKNGVEVTKEIYERKLPVKILILSNYDTFSFVRDALHYGAYDYLLKHQISETVLLTRLKELSDLIEKEGTLNAHLSFFTTVAKRKYLNSLLRSEITNQDEHAHMLTQKDFSCGSYCIAVMQITNFILVTHFSPDQNRKKLIDSIITMADNIFSSLDNGLITYMEYGQFVVLFHYDDLASTQEIWNQAVRSMNLFISNIRKLYGLTSMYQTSDVFNEIGRLPEVYQKTKYLLEHKPIPQSSLTFSGQDSISMEKEKKLMDALIARDEEQMERIMNEIFQNHSLSSGELPQKVIEQILKIGIRFQQDYKINIHENMEMKKSGIARMSDAEVYSFLVSYFKEIMKEMPENSQENYSLHIRKALQYIHKNFAQDLSLSIVAEYLHISPTHLSRLFSKEVGVSFIDYLVNYRIECARQLIRNTELDLKTIADRVGFHGYNYFLRTYKDKTGHTPSQEKGMDSY